MVIFEFVAGLKYFVFSLFNIDFNLNLFLKDNNSDKSKNSLF